MNSESLFSSFPKSETEYFIFWAFAIAFSWTRLGVSSSRLGISLHSHSSAPFLTNVPILGLGILRRGVLRRIRIDLARRLVLREVELFLDLTLALAQELKTLLMLEGSADLGFEFLAALVSICDVGLQPGGTLLEALDRGFQGTNCALRGV